MKDSPNFRVTMSLTSLHEWGYSEPLLIRKWRSYYLGGWTTLVLCGAIGAALTAATKNADVFTPFWFLGIVGVVLIFTGAIQLSKVMGFTTSKTAFIFFAHFFCAAVTGIYLVYKASDELSYQSEVDTSRPIRVEPESPVQHPEPSIKAPAPMTLGTTCPHCGAQVEWAYNTCTSCGGWMKERKKREPFFGWWHNYHCTNCQTPLAKGQSPCPGCKLPVDWR